MAELHSNLNPQRIPNRILWCLRIVVVLQVIGVGGRYVFSEHETESDIYGVLYFDLEWGESLVQIIDDGGARLCVGFAALIVLLGIIQLFFRQPTSLTPRHEFNAALLLSNFEAVCVSFIASWMLLLAVAHQIRGEPFAHLSLGEHAVRYVAPAVLAMLTFNLHSKDSLTSKINAKRSVVMWLLVLAAGATFAVHGYKAWKCHGHFVDLILLSDANWTHLEIEEAVAELALVVIGVADFIVATLLVLTRWKWVSSYMFFWGFITALSRLTALGQLAWPEPLIRSANWGVPLVILLWPSRSSLRHESKQF